MPWFPLAITAVSVAWLMLALSRLSMDLSNGLGFMLAAMILIAINGATWVTWAVVKLLGI